MYTAIASDLAIDAAAMESFAIDLLREDFAIVQILSTEGSGSGAQVVEYPVHLRGDEDGSWLIVDY
jgi:hypothetical protein